MKATVGGVEIGYEDSGSGTPVVFIHGFPLNRTMWKAQVEALSSDMRCIAIDLRSHGESEAFFWLTSVDIYAQQVVDLLDSLGINRAVICGFSMGGYVAFALYRAHPERFSGLILADTRAQPDSTEQREGRYQTARTAQKQGASAIAETLLPRLVSPKTLEGRSDVVAAVRSIVEGTPIPGIVGDLMTMASRPDSQETLSTISVPTLVLVGELDALTPPADAQLMAQGIKGARIEQIPGAAHMSPMEEAETFNRHVREFVRTIK